MTKFLEENAFEQWQSDGVCFFLYYHAELNHYCGYARFASRPLIGRGFDGFATYIPVHGGISFAREEEGTVTYGFDCSHLGDERVANLRDPEWLRAECERLAKAIRLAHPFERDYLEAITNKQKAHVIDSYYESLRRAGIDAVWHDNPMARLRALIGDL